MKRWKDAFGREIKIGDIVEDRDRRIIGKAFRHHGMPMIRIFKKFNAGLLNYEMIELKGPNEAYEYGMVPKRTKLWYWAHGYKLEHIEIIRSAQEANRHA